MNFSSKTLASLLIVGTLGVGITNAKKVNPENLETKIVSIDESAQILVQDPNQIVYNTINEILIKDFLKNYLAKVTPKSENFQGYEKKLGKEKLLTEYCKAHESCLRFAYEKLYPNEADFQELGKEIAEKQQRLGALTGSLINHENKAVIRNYVEWGKAKYDLFSSLLNASKNVAVSNSKTLEEKQEYIKTLMNLAYNRKGYALYLKKFDKICDNLYEDMEKSIGGWIRFFGERKIKKEFRIVSKYTKQTYLNTLNQFFEQEVGKKNERNKK